METCIRGGKLTADLGKLAQSKAVCAEFSFVHNRLLTCENARHACPPGTDRKSTVKSLDDYLYDIDNRPPNWELRVNLSIGLVIHVAVGGVAPLFILHWLGVRQWALILIPLLAAVLSVWWALRYLRRRGNKTKAIYAAHGGNTAGTSDLLFGQMNYGITPDGRWKWPEPSSTSE